MFKNGIYSYRKFVASEHSKNLSPSPGLKKLQSRKAGQSNPSEEILAIVSQAWLLEK